MLIWEVTFAPWNHIPAHTWLLNVQMARTSQFGPPVASYAPPKAPQKVNLWPWMKDNEGLFGCDPSPNSTRIGFWFTLWFFMQTIKHVSTYFVAVTPQSWEFLNRTHKLSIAGIHETVNDLGLELQYAEYADQPADLFTKVFQGSNSWTPCASWKLDPLNPENRFSREKVDTCSSNFYSIIFTPGIIYIFAYIKVLAGYSFLRWLWVPNPSCICPTRGHKKRFMVSGDLVRLRGSN